MTIAPFLRRMREKDHKFNTSKKGKKEKREDTIKRNLWTVTEF